MARPKQVGAGRKIGDPGAAQQNQHAAIFYDRRTKRERDRSTQGRLAIFRSQMGEG